MKDAPHSDAKPGMAIRERRTGIPRVWAAAALVALALLPAAAQVPVGENGKVNLSGDIATGYSGSFGDTGSGHDLTLGGNASLHGYYYSPQFLSFDFQPYYNRSQSNSSYQSITNSSGFIGSVNLFGGSHFPGTVSFAKTSDSTGQFGIPGVSGLNTDGSGQTLNISWSMLVPDLPTVHASYTMSGQDVSVPGADGDTHLGSRILNLGSDYTLLGFRLRGTYNRITNSSDFPAFLGSGERASVDGESSSLGGMVSHAIPLRGYWSAQVTHSGFASNFGNGGSAGSSDGSNTSLSTTVTMNPLSKLGVGFGAEYQTNLFGALQQQIVAAGGTNPIRSSETSGSATAVNGSASYTISRYIFLTGQFSHRELTFEGANRTITQYGGGVNFNFSRRLLGALSFSVGANDIATQEGNSGAGLYANMNFSRRIRGWDVSSNLSYSQSVQTLLATYTTSMYGYGANVRRKFGESLYWGATVNGSHSGLQRVAGSTSHSESFSSYLNYRRYTLNALYSESAGVSILTAQGLVPIPTGIPSPLLSQAVLYNARSYGGGGSATMGRLVLSLSYAKAISQTGAMTGLSDNGSTLINGRLRYRVRKLYFDSGFTRFEQSIGAAGGQPKMMNSYYFGISRWFKVF